MLESHLCYKVRQHAYWRVLCLQHHVFRHHPRVISSSIRGCKNKSKSVAGNFGPGISKDMKQFEGFRHSHCGRFKGATNTGHMLYVVMKLPNGLKPSVATQSLRFLTSSLKSGYLLSKCFHAWPSTGWLNSPSFVFLVLFHWVPSDVKFHSDFSKKTKKIKWCFKLELQIFWDKFSNPRSTKCWDRGSTSFELSYTPHICTNLGYTFHVGPT
jgi:hypothetical protein